MERIQSFNHFSKHKSGCISTTDTKIVAPCNREGYSVLNVSASKLKVPFAVSFSAKVVQLRRPLLLVYPSIIQGFGPLPVGKVLSSPDNRKTRR